MHSTPDGVTPEVWRIAKLAGRVRTTRDPASQTDAEKASMESIETTRVCRGVRQTCVVQAAQDREVSNLFRESESVHYGADRSREPISELESLPPPKARK